VGTPELFREAIREAARVGDVIASLGPTGDSAALGDLPGNVAVHRFVPTSSVMDNADLTAGIPRLPCPTETCWRPSRPGRTSWPLRQRPNFSTLSTEIGRAT